MNSFRNSAGLMRRVLIVEDEPINREMLGNIIQQDYEVSYAEDGRQALDMLQAKDKKCSLILLDLLMPKMDGMTFLDRIRTDEELRSIPVIVVTSEEDAEVECIRRGAVDFIRKPYDMPEVILARCRRIVELSEDKAVIRSAERDTLTGLYTKDFFYEYIRQMEHYNSRRDMDAVVINVERFHLINESYGRQGGNAVLQRISELITEQLNSCVGIACRVEADTFFIYWDHRDDYETLVPEMQNGLDHSDIARTRIRVGVYKDVDKADIEEIWFDHAKTACDRVRGNYTHQLAMYDLMLHKRTLYQERLIRDIDGAIINRDLVVFYQPKYMIRGDRPVLCSAEALIRWKHPELGMISPGDFVPLFESNGLIQKLDEYVWREAAAQIRKWREKYNRTIPVSVNVSRIDIYDPMLEEKLEELLERHQLSPEEIMLEITESAYADNAQCLIEVVERLRERGFKIEMDDFGSGYSSLNMITTIPIDVLKMDMKFIRNMEKDEKSMKLVELVLDIAKFLKVPVVAEGVETQSQLDKLKERGCDIIQGYFFSKPVPPEEFEVFIQNELNRNT